MEFKKHPVGIKNVLLAVIMLFIIGSVYATSLSIQMPKNVKVGDEFNITLNVKNDQPLAGFECNIETPDNLKIVSISGNKNIKKMAGKFYQEKVENGSCIIKFAVFDNTINSSFYAGNVTIKVLKYYNNTYIKIKSVGSDEEGHRINIYYNDIKLNISKDDNVVKSGQTDTGTNTGGIIEQIINFIKRLLGE
jgi:hypothetical protein